MTKLQEAWWGKGEPWKEDKSIRFFQVNVSDEILEDLRYRLNHAVSFIPPLEGTQHQYGFNTNLLLDIVNFWKTKYNWREREKLINKYPQFVTQIQGLDIHYVHIKPKATGVKILPLLMVHGYFMSFTEFHGTIPVLTTPQKEKNFVFELIIPSLPGYGFSDAAVRPGLGAAQMALVFKNLMERLGFEQFYMLGRDLGGIILQHLAVLFPDRVLGFHNSMCILYNTPMAILKIAIGTIHPTWFTREDHVHRLYPLEKLISWLILESGYLHIQATKPDTIGVALGDSPVGLASYMLEKIGIGTDSSRKDLADGGLKGYNYHDLLDQIMIYWATRSITTSMRLYSETFNKKHLALGILRQPVPVPTACLRFAKDFYSPDGVLPEIYPNLLQLSDYEGGHFGAFQAPDIFAKDIIMAVEKFENYNMKEAHLINKTNKRK